MRREEQIGNALVEEPRPPLYTAMKYWGKKPHNVWRHYIETNTPIKGIVMDPFAGSAVSAFEAIKARRSVIATDLNPLTSFIIEVLSSEYFDDEFTRVVEDLTQEISRDPQYLESYHTTCRKCGSDAIIQSCKWDSGSIYEVAVLCDACGHPPYVSKPTEQDTNNSIISESMDIAEWYPKDEFYNSPSFSSNLLKALGGNQFHLLWTKRNLLVLSKIFCRINRVNNDNLRLQLAFGFIQSVHLCSKMCVPRRDAAKRHFSTSWGRAGYFLPKRQMEMNPLLLFRRSCIGKQSVRSALLSRDKYLGVIPRIIKIQGNAPQQITKPNVPTIFYGAMDIADIDKSFPMDSIDFIITDPPYGGLIQYIDLSHIWLIWLKHLYPDMKVDPNKEITVKRGMSTYADYRLKLTDGLSKMHDLLKQDSAMVITFHNTDLKAWEGFLFSIISSGFTINNVVLQQNRRTGESNVSNPYGTSASDFYVICSKKSPDLVKVVAGDEFEELIYKISCEIIIERNEATPYLLLFNGVISALISQHILFQATCSSLKDILNRKNKGTFIICSNNNNEAGDIWDLLKRQELSSRQPLNIRIENKINDIISMNYGLNEDQIIGMVLSEFSGILMPDIRMLKACIKERLLRSKSTSMLLNQQKGV